MIRTYRAEDLGAVERLVAELQEYERAIDDRLLEGSEMARAYTAAMLERCNAWAGRVLVAETEDGIIGFAAVQAAVPSEELDEPPGTYALISDLVVTAARRGTGLGRALLAAAEDHARAYGANEIRIAVLAGNAVADELYRTAGFRPYVHILSKRLTDPERAIGRAGRHSPGQSG